MARNVKKYLPIIITALVVLFIFSQSLMTADESTVESSAVFERLLALFPFLTHHLVRKLAHFTEFTVFGACIAFLFRNSSKRWLSILAPLVIVPLVDETIQYFSDGRTPKISDVWIDMAGAAAGIFFLYILLRLYRMIKNRPGS